MAKLISSHNNLSDGIDELKAKSRKWLIGVIVCFVLFIPTGGLTFIPFAVCGFMYSKYARPLKLKQIGLEGGERTEEALMNLSDDYTVFPNIKLNIEGKETFIDYTVVGPNGIFVIKAKSLNGEIVGDASEQQLTQHKTGRKGGQYSKYFYNPLKQASSHVYKLSQFLRGYNLDSRIQGMVYFSNPDCDVFISNSALPVFSYRDNGYREIVEYITDYNNGIPMPFEKQQAIINLLLGTVNSGSNYNGETEQSTEVFSPSFNEEKTASENIQYISNKDFSER